MTVDEIKGRLDALQTRAARLGKYTFVFFSIMPRAAQPYGLTIKGDHGDIFKGDNIDVEALFAAAHAALDDADPANIARTLGIEPSPAQVAAE